MLDGVTPVAGVVDVSDQVVTFTPDVALEVLTTYTVEVDGLLDVAGNLGTPFTSGFWRSWVVRCFGRLAQSNLRSLSSQ